MNYNPYTESELYQIIHNTREVSSNPYSLFVAYVLYALFEHLDEEFEFENEDDHYEEYWKTDISHKEFWDILGNAAEDFVSAVENHLQVDINGKAYTIRHTDQFDKSKLKYVFLFNQHAVNGMCPVRKEYIFNVSGEERKTFKEIQSDAKLNKAYFWKIVYAVDKLGRYDDLTDIEAATYCFGLYYSKHVSLETDRKYMLKFMDEVFSIESSSSYLNAFGAAWMPYYDPYAKLVMEEPLDMKRVRNGEPKYLVRGLYAIKYPELEIPFKIPMPRPVDAIFRDWEGPKRDEFRKDIPMDTLTGNQKWQLWCAEQFLDTYFA